MAGLLVPSEVHYLAEGLATDGEPVRSTSRDLACRAPVPEGEHTVEARLRAMDAGGRGRRSCWSLSATLIAPGQLVVGQPGA